MRPRFIREATMQNIDLRSDTVTQPTSKMRAAMAQAEVGDDGYDEDPTVHQLEAVAAARMGKEAAVFVASGTMADLISVIAHCERGDEMIAGNRSHIFKDEMGAASTLGGILMRTVRNDARGMLDLDEVETAMRRFNTNRPRIALVCLENTHNRCGGTVLDANDTRAVAEVAHRHNAAIHLDGARIFNAAVALHVPVSALARPADTVSFCLSKGLCCPVGSLVCGAKEVVAYTRKYRRMVGGGWRQAGILAAAGLVALDSMVDRLAEDHAIARRLAASLAQIPGLTLDADRVQTNIVIFEVLDLPCEEFIARLKERGVLVSYPGGNTVRMVTHHGLTAQDIDEAASIVEAVVRDNASATGGRRLGS
jgi:threonine aldolase